MLGSRMSEFTKSFLVRIVLVKIRHIASIKSSLQSNGSIRFNVEPENKTNCKTTYTGICICWLYTLFVFKHIYMSYYIEIREITEFPRKEFSTRFDLIKITKYKQPIS